MPWNEPQSQKDYNAQVMEGVEITGFGPNVRTTTPCPWCTWPGFQTWRITHTEEDMRKDWTCEHCGRSGTHLIVTTASGGIEATFVQTGGPPPPEWLEIKPPHIDDPSVARFKEGSA